MDFWPDKFVNYWAVVVNKNDFPNVGFKIQGEFPNARYFSYNVYGEDRNSTASLFDIQIKAENCSANPFKNHDFTKKNKDFIQIGDPKMVGSKIAKGESDRTP